MRDGQHIVGRIELRDVGFRYPSREAWAVRHLNMAVEAGKTVAIVGESGSGNTTALQLLLRFYEATRLQRARSSLTGSTFGLWPERIYVAKSHMSRRAQCYSR